MRLATTNTCGTSHTTRGDQWLAIRAGVNIIDSILKDSVEID
jgi:hypothetical protein